MSNGYISNLLRRGEIEGDLGVRWYLPVTMGYDRYPERLIDEKRRFLEDKLARGVRLFFTHDAEIAAAEVSRDDRGRFATREEMPTLDGLTLAA